MQTLLGVSQKAMYMPESSWIQYIKQDLPFAKSLGNITISNLSFPNGSDLINSSTPTFGVRSFFTASAGTEVVAHYADGSAAMTRRSVGTGTAIYSSFLPGLSYFHPATPLAPPDRGTTDLNSAHFIPVDFDPVAAAVISWPARQMVKKASAHILVALRYIGGRPRGTKQRWCSSAHVKLARQANSGSDRKHHRFLDQRTTSRAGQWRASAGSGFKTRPLVHELELERSRRHCAS